MQDWLSWVRSSEQTKHSASFWYQDYCAIVIVRKWKLNFCNEQSCGTWTVVKMSINLRVWLDHCMLGRWSAFTLRIASLRSIARPPSKLRALKGYPSAATSASLLACMSMDDMYCEQKSFSRGRHLSKICFCAYSHVVKCRLQWHTSTIVAWFYKKSNAHIYQAESVRVQKKH